MLHGWAVVAALALLGMGAAVADDSSGGLSFAWLDLKPGIVKADGEIAVTVCIENTSAQTVSGVTMGLSAPQIAIPPMLRGPLEFRPKEVKWLTWHVVAMKPGRFQITVLADTESMHAERSQTLTVVAESAGRPAPKAVAMPPGEICDT